MDRILLLVTAVLVSCSVVQVVHSECVSDTRCVPAADCEACRRYKCAKAMNDKNLKNLDCNRTNAYIGGNQCCNRNFLDGMTGKRRRRQATNPEKYPDRLWSNPIGFYYDTNLDGNIIAKVAGDVFSYLQAQTCLRFVRASVGSTTPYINLTAGSSCTSYVGRSESTSSVITLTPQCAASWGEVLYFVLQILGLFHQSQRPDRDDSITINYTNVDEPHKADFAKLDPSDLQTTFGLPYDLASATQFPPKIFSKNGLYTILTNDRLYQQTIGQRVEMSAQDVKLLNFLYCNATCSRSPLSGTCLSGGYQDPNNCTQCKCPDGYAGQFCEKYKDTTGKGCGGEITVSTTEMNISSPGYFGPGYYDSYTECVWLLRAPNRESISLRFTGDFGVFQDVSEACDHWIETRLNKSLNLTGPRFCGQTRPEVTLVSNRPEVMLIFKSNLSDIPQNLRRGFLISIKIVCTSETCLNGGQCVEGRCTCPPGFTGTQCEIGPTSATTFPPSSPPSTTSPVPTSCTPNPCRNNGTCSWNGSAVICQCINGFSGPYCNRAPCGGCNISPGFVESKCIIPESPPRTCQVQSSVDSTSGWWFFCRTSTRVVSRNVTCTWSVCCEGATELGDGCGVLGWTNWCSCPVNCGGATQTRFQYGTRTDRLGRLYYDVVATQQQNCNTNKCDCSTQPRRYRPWYYACSPCNGPNFVESGDQCVPRS